MTQDHLLHHEAGLDGLSQADVVGNQQVDPGHRECPDNGIELVLIYFDAAAKRRLQGSSSAWEIAPQRTASRKACRLSGWSNEWGSGRVDFSCTVVPGSISQIT